jgi:hypothetical protein
MVKAAGKETMSVAELREKLNEFPQDMAVFATWEGVLAPITPDNFLTVGEMENGMPAARTHLEIDVENY